MYMKSSFTKNSYTQQSNFKDPLNIDTMRYKYLHSPYDTGTTRIRTDNAPTRIRTQYRDSGYFYEKQLLRLQKQALESQLKQQKRSGSKKQAMKAIQDLHIKNMIKEEALKRKDNSYEHSSAIRQKNKTLSSYEDIYKKETRSPHHSIKYPPKMNYSMLGSPQQDASNLSKFIEDTSDTKAAIFRRLYDHKSKLKNKSELSDRIQTKKSQEQQGSQVKDQVESICESNEATFLEEISFLKAQLQEKNKTIVDLQCQLIKKSARRNSQRQRHKSDFGVSSLHQSPNNKNQDLEAKITRVRQLEIEERNIDLRIQSQVIPMPKPIRNFDMLQPIKIEGKNKDSIGTNTQVKARQLQSSKLKHERIRSQQKLLSQSQIQTEELPLKTLTYTKQYAETISPLEEIHAKQIQKYRSSIKQRMGQSNRHQIRIDPTNKEDPRELTNEDSRHIQKEDKQCQTSDNMYDYIEEAYLQWVFEKDYQELQARKQKQQEGKP